MKKLLCVLLSCAILLTCISGCAKNGDAPSSSDATVVFTDDAGREVTVPKQITHVAPSGSTAQMILLTISPELLVGLSSDLSTAQLPYLQEGLSKLPIFGQFYGSKANLNMEALIAAQPQIIIDIGDAKKTIAEDMDGIQAQTGIPTVFIEASLETMPDAYRKLGKLLNCTEVAEQRAVFIEKTLQMAAENSAKVPDEQRKSVMFGTSETGLACNAEGSTQADVITLVGATNAIKTDEISNRNGGTAVDLEQVYTVDPDVIILSADGPYDTLAGSEWSDLTAVRNGTFYEIPNLPYDWMSMPPSVNRVLGIWWLGNLLYPEQFDYDMVAVAQEYYSLFWHYDLTADEAEAFLSRSTGK